MRGLHCSGGASSIGLVGFCVELGNLTHITQKVHLANETRIRHCLCHYNNDTYIRIRRN